MEKKMNVEVRPISDLRNNFKSISEEVHEKEASIILTKNGYADMVVMSYEKYAEHMYWEKVSDLIEEADDAYRKTGIAYDAESVLSDLKEKYNFK